jgi:hypothetical protein
MVPIPSKEDLLSIFCGICINSVLKGISKEVLPAFLLGLACIGCVGACSYGACSNFYSVFKGITKAAFILRIRRP